MSDLLVNLRLKAIDGVSSVAKTVAESLHGIEKAGEQLHEKLKGMVDLKASADALKEVGEKFTHLGESILEPILHGAEAFNALKDNVESTGIGIGATEEQMTAMFDAADRLGRTTSIGADKVAEGFRGLASSGLSAEDQLKAIEPTLQLAKVGHIDMARAAELSGSLLKRFGLEAEALPGLLDTIAGTAKAGGGSVADLSAALATAAPNASRFGVGVSDVAALAGALAQTGVKGEAAGSVIDNMIVKLATARRIGAQGLKLLGIDTTDKTTGQLKTIPALLGEIDEKTSKMGSKRRERFIEGIFGEGSAKSVSKLMEALRSGGLDKFREEAGKASGELRKMFGEMEHLGASERMKNAIDGLSRSIGKVFGPTLEKVEGFIADTINGISEWADKNPDLVDTLTSLAGAVGIVAVAIGGVFSALGGLLLANIAINTFAAAFPILGAAVGAAFLPFLAAAAAVTAVTVALGLLTKHWDELNAREGFKGMLDMVREQGALKTVGALFGIGKIGSSGETSGAESVGALGRGEFTPDKGHIDPNTHQWIPNAVAASGAGGATRVGGSLTIKVDGPGQVTHIDQKGPMDIDVDGGLAMAGGG